MVSGTNRTGVKFGGIIAAAFLAGGTLPAAEPAGADEPWWSLAPVVEPPVPALEAAGENPIDRFLEVERQSRGLEAVGPADKLVLLRRVYLDLIGLPPSPEDQQAFLADSSPDAYEKVVDRLLESEQHAVRYGRHWLDVLRYSDADERMTAAPGIHLWRDWVIDALADDVPYDEFVQVQLTGRRSDERTQMSATGYRSEKEMRPGDLFALGFLARGAGVGPQDLAINAVDTVSTAFMGMTVGCAKCHDHMFDPISEVDYYSMKALFDPLVLRKVTLAGADDLIEAGKVMAERDEKRAPLVKELAALLEPFKSQLYEERVEMLPAEVKEVIRKPEEARSVAEQKIADDYFPILRIDDGKIDEILPDEIRKQAGALKKQLGEVDRSGPRGPEIPVFHTVEVDRIREQEKSYVLTSGDAARPELDNEVQPGWPFSGGDYDFRDGRVEAFTDWLTAPENPLFARVAVNRMWQWHFGTGLHQQPSDFGKQAGEPTHPALLDWLAAEFVRGGYRMKRMHRLMVTSRAYRMASESGPAEAASQQADPGNTWLWHFRLERLEAEPVWDSIHAAAGKLDLAVGGRSFEPGRGRRGKEAATVRRASYMIRGYSPSRDLTPGFLQTFDVDDGRVPCPVRTRTVTAPQSLFLMNSPEIETASAALADRLRESAGGDLKAAVDEAYRLTVGRPPDEAETGRALDYLQGDPDRLKALCWLIFNLDEFIYVR
ncbi:DUF1549 and DUF1553 domain-containing protein [Luteolibacter marinus]|uniref:DUF1549 and DUF1553 domain-containing protein n=1 Tax=Luteolibacter marinus TaxID=2776705 RepID=UPI0018685E55|nr:DUF1549 and DUF1553 domain-containing protein [Luteolibacter marinus]